tara:strand:- start:5679 stop:7736 length:2058 start_codon:yes stop_codon:yes gene_type:complete
MDKVTDSFELSDFFKIISEGKKNLEQIRISEKASLIPEREINIEPFNLSDFFKYISESKDQNEKQLKKEEKDLKELETFLNPIIEEKNEIPIEIDEEELAELSAPIKVSDKKEQPLVIEQPEEQPKKQSLVIEQSVDEIKAEESKKIKSSKEKIKTPPVKVALNKLIQDFENFKKTYSRDFNRISQQMSTVGGGGEVRLEFLDDINRDSVKVDGKYLKYDSSTSKWIGASAIQANSVDGSMLALGSDASGDVMYYNGTDYVRLAKGSDDQVLTLASGVPSWADAAVANFTASANNSTDETVYPVFVDGATGAQGAETDTGFTYNPSTGTLTSTTFVGALTGNASGTAATVTGAAQSSITSLGTLTTLTVDSVIINGTTIGHTSDTDLVTVADGVLTVAGELDATTLDISGNADIDGTLEADAYTVDGTALNEYIADTVGAMVGSNTETGITVTYQDGDNTIDFVVGTLNQNTTGNADTATLATTVTVSDSTANTNFPVVFHNESNALLDDTGALRYNPSTGELLVPKLTVAGTTTQVDTVTMQAANAVVFEGATADAHETILSVVDPTGDHTQYLINQGGYIPLLAAATTTTITSTPAELNLLDGITAGIISASLAVIVDSNKDITGFRNVTLTGELDAATLDISSDADIDGTLEADAYTVNGTTLAEYILEIISPRMSFDHSRE